MKFMSVTAVACPGAWRLRSTLWGPATYLVFCGLLAACADSANIRHVADKTPIEAKMGETTRPVKLSKVVVKAKRGEDIGAIQTGLMCLPDEDIVYRGRDSRYTIEDEEYTQVFREELEAANYEVVGDPDALFEDPSEWKAQYKIAGLIKKIRANICFPYSTFGNYETGTAEAAMEVEWQIYSRLDRQVVHKLTTTAKGIIESPQLDPHIDVYLLAFAQTTRNMLADEKLHDRLVGKKVTEETGRPQTVALTTNPAPFQTPIAGRINDVRLNVVTVIAGDGWGSGFFIDRTGHLLTNEHVVRTADLVKIRVATGREVLGEVIARNARRDVALIKTEPSGVPGLPIAHRSPNPGADVYAVGSPIDVRKYHTTVSRGVLSAYRVEDGLEFIQSDVNVLWGSSGGPLLDAQGNVIGITVKGELHRGYPGLNLFVTIQDALDSLGIKGLATVAYSQNERPSLPRASTLQSNSSPKVWRTINDDVLAFSEYGGSGRHLKMPTQVNLELVRQEGDWGVFEYSARNNQRGEGWILMENVR